MPAILISFGARWRKLQKVERRKKDEVVTATALGDANADEEEYRLDTDGQPYTRQSFVEVYGGTVEWDQAPVAM